MKKRRHSILLVDDESGILDVLYNALVDKYAVYRASGAVEALDILKGNSVDLILSNQPMPASVGGEVFPETGKSPSSPGRVLRTGGADLQRAVDAILGGSIETSIKAPWVEDPILPIALVVLNVRLKQNAEEKKRLEMQLVRNEKMASLGELTAGVAHELNTPLSFIHANLLNLKKFYDKITVLLDCYEQIDLPGDVKKGIQEKKKEINYDYIKERMGKMIDRSSVGTDRMNQIIQDLKSFSRMDAGKFTVSDINANIETTLGIMSHEAKNRIEIKREFGNLPPIACYIGKLNQVFLNLLVNACHAIEDKGEIRIKTELGNGMVKIQISDTGRGISKDIIDHIFDPFFTTKPVGQGTGLGLSISRNIIKQHKGEISVKSDPGRETTFTIRIPANLDEAVSDRGGSMAPAGK